MRALRIAGGILGFFVLLAVGTYVAGEQTEVAVLHTVDDAGASHATKMWVVDHDGATWVRVARPERRWFQRLQAQPHVEITRGGRTQAMVAVPDRSPEARATIDPAFRAKYGLVDWWYGLLLRSNPIPVRLDPAPPAA
jgi:hypothetical protein